MSIDNTYRLNLIEKTCTNCRVVFKSRPDRKGLVCSISCRASNRNKRVGSGLPKQEVARRNKRLKTYGITHEDFLLLWDNQQGKCAICTVELLVGGRGANSCHVDHDHNTGQVRGLLCLSCNHGIGKFYDKAEMLNKAADYLLGKA